MENIENLKSIIANKLIYYRKQNGLTQQELADKLNYSDKSISKWERGEGVPDIYILKQIADLYGITVNDLIDSSAPAKPVVKHDKKRNHILICLESIGLVWLVATIIFAVLKIIFEDAKIINYTFLYAIPISFLLLYIFNRLWFRKKYISVLSISLMSWSILFCFYWTIKDFLNNFGVFFFVGIPFQILIIFWYLMDKRKNNTK